MVALLRYTEPQSVINLLPMCSSHLECRFGDDRVHEQKGYLKYAAGEGDMSI